MATAAVLTKPTFTLADRLRIQQERARDRDFRMIGRLSAIVFEGQRNIRGISQARPRWYNAEQSKAENWISAENRDAMAPFSEKQSVLWSSITLDWLGNKTAPMIAMSRDQQDLLLPYGLTPLPDIPDPRWTPKHAGDKVKRIPQLLTGCPVVGDRVRDKITDRAGRVYGVIHPVLELSIMLSGVSGGFGRIRGAVDPSDGTHLALLIDDEMHAYFVGGKFLMG